MKPCYSGCGRLVSPAAMIDGWRETCAVRTLDLIRDLQSLPPPALGLLVSILRDHGRNELADVIVGCVPFDGDMMQ